MMRCLDSKLLKNTIIYGVSTFIIIILIYNFLDIKITKQIYYSNDTNIRIITLSSLISYLLSSKFWIIVTLIVTILCFIRYFFNKPSNNLYILAISLILSIVVSGILKFLLARYRPEMLLFKNQYNFHFLSFKKNYNSIPSGHTTLSFTGLLAIANFYKKEYITIIAIILAIIGAISRIILLDHYLTDVILSAYIGSFCYLWTKSFVEGTNNL